LPTTAAPAPRVPRTNRPLSICIVILGALAACRTASRQTPSTRSTADQTPSARSTEASSPPALEAPVAHTPWRPRHKGGADLATGIYNREDDDLVINTPMPLVLRRTYNSGDGHARQFGMDTRRPGEWWLYGAGNRRVPWAELILADGGRIHFVRISPGNTMADAVLRHQGTPGEFEGALLTWNGWRWEMRQRDGSVTRFLDCPTKQHNCSIVERRDRDGHRIAYVRDDSGTLQRMEE